MDIEHSVANCGGWFGAKRSHSQFSFSTLVFTFFHPFIIVLQIVSVIFVPFLGFHEFVEVVFPSSLGSSDLSSCFDVFVQSRMPVEYFPIPSCFRQGNDSPCHTPLQSSVYFNPASYIMFFHLFLSFIRASFDVIDPVFFIFSGVNIFIGIFLKDTSLSWFFLNPVPSLRLSLCRSYLPPHFSAFSVPSSFLSIFTFLVCIFVSSVQSGEASFSALFLIIFSCFSVSVHVLLA